MAKSVEVIELFNQGMMGSVDSKDIPVESAAYSENLNPVAVQGKLSGIEEDELFLTGADGTAYSLIGDGDTAIFYDGASVKAITAIGTSPVLGSALSTPGALSYADSVSDGKAVHFGLGTGTDPEWFGEIDYGQFGASAPSGIQAESALLKGPGSTVSGTDIHSVGSTAAIAASDSSETVWPEGQTIYVYASLVYDGYQESPLGYVTKFNVGSGFPNGYKRINLVDYELDTGHADWSQRINGVNFYVATAIGSDDGETLEEPIFALHIDINDAAWTGPVSDVYTYSSTISLDHTGGQDYVTRTGISSSVEHYDIRWGLSANNGAYHYITRCQHDDLPEAERMIFRSRPYKFNAFDWINDFVILPEKPIALAAFSGRIFAFTKYKTFEIDGHILDISHTHEGIGCLGQDSLCVTDRGMFFADANNIYLHDGSGIHTIGNGVLKNDENTKASWLDADHSTYNPVCGYDARSNAFVIAYINGSDSTVSLLTYRSARMQTIDLPRGRWDHYPTEYTTLSGVMMGATGRVIMGFDGNLYEVFGGSDKRDWTITFREFSTPTYTKYHDARLIGTDATVEYSEDGAAFAAATTALDGTGVYKARVNAGSGRTWNRVRTFQLRISGTGDQEVDSVSVTRRNLVQT